MRRCVTNPDGLVKTLDRRSGETKNHVVRKFCTDSGREYFRMATQSGKQMRVDSVGQAAM